MDRKDFISNLSSALGRPQPSPTLVASPGRYADFQDATNAAEQVRHDASSRSTALLDEAASALETGGWKVHRAETIEDVGDIVVNICRDIDAKSALRSGHDVLDEAQIDNALGRAGIDLQNLNLRDRFTDEERAEKRAQHRKEVFRTDVGITGGDYVIAETGTLVIHPKKGVSRLTSLAPPVHVAVIKRGQILPSLDELFLLEHVDIHTGNQHAGMNLISGPSRTGDIEATIVHGIHGPIETHIVLVG